FPAQVLHAGVEPYHRCNRTLRSPNDVDRIGRGKLDIGSASETSRPLTCLANYARYKNQAPNPYSTQVVRKAHRPTITKNNHFVNHLGSPTRINCCSMGLG